MSATPDLGELLAEVVAFVRGTIAVSIPATVLSYDSTKQTITVKPTISGRYKLGDQLLPFALPTVANVPVAFPSATGFAITWPLAPGDSVLLVLADRSIDEWKSTGAQECVPQDIRRFDLTDAVAIPGTRPFTRPVAATGVSPVAMVLEGADIRLGSSAAVDPVALSSKVLAELNKIIVAFNAHAHSAPGTTPPTALIPPATPVSALKVKAE